MFSTYIFYLLSALAIYAAVMMLISKKPIHSVLYLTLVFFSIAGHYILLNAQFLAIVHIIVYAGAIMVLFLFTVMLLNLNKEEYTPKPFLVRLTAVITSGLFLVVLIGVFHSFDLQMVQNPEVAQFGLVKNLGRILFHEYLLPFEFSSVLFLTAMVGAVLLGKKEQI